MAARFFNPLRQEVRQFYQHADPLLDHERLWFDDAMRNAIGKAMTDEAKKLGYTVYALAVCANHVHAVVRAHRDRAVVIWQKLANASLLALLRRQPDPKGSPLWSDRPYKVFKYDNAEVESCIQYVYENPIKAGLPPQHWNGIVPFRPINAAKGKQPNTPPRTQGAPPACPAQLRATSQRIAATAKNRPTANFFFSFMPPAPAASDCLSFTFPNCCSRPVPRLHVGSMVLNRSKRP